MRCHFRSKGSTVLGENTQIKHLGITAEAIDIGGNTLTHWLGDDRSTQCCRGHTLD
jgi:hypothetical protein